MEWASRVFSPSLVQKHALETVYGELVMLHTNREADLNMIRTIFLYVHEGTFKVQELNAEQEDSWDSGK